MRKCNLHLQYYKINSSFSIKLQEIILNVCEEYKTEREARQSEWIGTRALGALKFASETRDKNVSAIRIIRLHIHIFFYEVLSFFTSNIFMLVYHFKIKCGILNNSSWMFYIKEKFESKKIFFECRRLNKFWSSALKWFVAFDHWLCVYNF